MEAAKKQPEDRIVWEKRFKEFQASGKSQAVWCKEKNINPNTFNFWYLRLKREKAAPGKPQKESVKWLAIEPKEIETKTETNIIQPTDRTIKIKIADVSIEVKPGFEPEHDREGPPIILYDYQTTRAGKHPAQFLKEFKGYLHTDGYGGYNGLPNVIQVGCWAHARRKFDEALKALPASQKNTPLAVQEGLGFCNKLFAIERELQDVKPDERYKKRMELSRPVLDAFRDWLRYQTPRVLPKSALGQAIQYCRNQWDKLEGFMKDGRLEIDNNRSERSIKPFVIGRKNWLFANTPKGAGASATIYSVVETAKENGINPFEYLKFLFEKMPNMDLADHNAFEQILPWSKSLPDCCRI